MATTANALDLPYRVVGNQRETVTDVTFGTKYTTGGLSVTPAELGLSYLERADCSVQNIGEGSVNVANAVYDETNKKIILYDETPGEVASEAEVKAPIIRVTARGH
jgi:hypothetical protein